MKPAVITLDVNETLSDLAALDARFEQVGAPAQLRAAWFAGTLRDGFALTAAGGSAEFPRIARDVLEGLLSGLSELDRPPREAAGFILEGMAELPLHPDVGPGVQRLAAAGIRLVTLTNGAAESTRALLGRHGLIGQVEMCLSVEDVGRWKPAPEPYRYAAERCGVRAGEMMLVAVHPWDVHGAKRAGLRAAWITRDGGSYPDVFEAPDLTCRDLIELAESLH